MAKHAELKIEWRRGWQWRLRVPGLLNDWFEQYEQRLLASPVKANPARAVFKVNDQYFVKLDRPQTLWHKLRARWRCKAEAEFETAMRLEQAGIPVVSYLGWGHRWPLSMTLSAAMPDAVTAWEFWVRKGANDQAARSLFLERLADFLKKIFRSGFFHPDFHPGNVLYRPSSGELALVDVYGITGPSNISPVRLARMHKIILAFRDVLGDAEMSELALAAGIRSTLEDAGAWLHAALQAEAAALDREWPKRRQQLLENYRKFIAVASLDGREYLLRRSPCADPLLSPAELSSILHSGALEKITLPADEALTVWLKSFRLQFYAIAHRQPLAFEKHGQFSSLYFRKVDGRIPDPTAPEVAEFLNRCAVFSIRPAPANLLRTNSGQILINNPALPELKVYTLRG